MRILLFAEWFANLGGSETFNEQLFIELHRVGVNVMLVTREEESKIHPKWKKKFQQYSDNFVIVSADDGVNELIECIAKFKPEVIHFSPYEKTAWEYLKTVSPNIPVLGTESSDGSDLCYWSFYKEKLPEIIHQFNYIHCVSSRATKNLPKYFNYNNNTIVIPPPFPALPFQQWKGEQKQFRILFAGRLAQEKGIIFLLSVWNELQKQHKNLSLDIWGTGPQEGEIKQLIKSNALEKYIHLKGEYLSFTSIPINQYDMLIVPSHFEGLPYVFMEGMSTGIPVIVTKNSGARDLSDDPMLFQTIAPKNVEALKIAVNFIYDRFDTMKNYAEKRRSLIAKKCAVENVTQQFIEVYKKIIKENSIDTQPTIIQHNTNVQ